MASDGVRSDEHCTLFFFQAEDGIRDYKVTGVQTCALPICILIILGHPSASSLCAGLADAYAQGARDSGAEVRLLRLGELDFDPLLHAGYRQDQPLEPDQIGRAHV